MPEFTLDCGNIEGRLSFDALPAIVRGYIEAAFFTGVRFWPVDGEPFEVEEVGFLDLDPEGLEQMKTDALRFWIENRRDIAAAIEAAPEYDLTRAGHDLWFSRNGHGTGFWDRGLGDIGERLDAAAAKMGECDLFAEPAPPGWRVLVEQFETPPLTDTECATLAALIRESP